MRYCINIIKSNRELYTLSNNFFKIFLIVLLSFILLFSISCNNTYNASSVSAKVGDARFSGILKRISFEGKGWEDQPIDSWVNANSFELEIKDNKVSCAYIKQEQLVCPDYANPNVVEASQKTQEKGETRHYDNGRLIYYETYTITYTAYIKITFDNTDNPTTAKVEYRFKYYCPRSSKYFSDTITAIYEGTLNYDDSRKDIPPIVDFF